MKRVESKFGPSKEAWDKMVEINKSHSYARGLGMAPKRIIPTYPEVEPKYFALLVQIHHEIAERENIPNNHPCMGPTMKPEFQYILDTERANFLATVA